MLHNVVHKKINIIFKEFESPKVDESLEVVCAYYFIADASILMASLHMLHKPFLSILYQGSGDVKYHLGAASSLMIDGKRMHISLLPNPSHLEGKCVHVSVCLSCTVLIGL